MLNNFNIKSVLLFLVLAIPLSSFAQDPKQIPDEFIGEWVADIKYCDNPDILHRIRIENTGISYWESVGDVLSLYEISPLEIAAIMAFSGEGHEWIGLAHFKLSADRKVLTEYTSGFETIVRFKCEK